MAKIKIDFDKLNLTEEEKKKIEEQLNNNIGQLSGCIKSSRSGCMLVLIIPLIISITMVCLINFK